MGKINSKSKIVPISRFNTTSPQEPDFISGTYDSEIVVLNKAAQGKKHAKPHSWLVKRQKNAQSFTEDQQHYYAIKNRCEVFSAWQYESFIGDGQTQPKYYLLQEAQGIDSIATKAVPGFKSLNEMVSNYRDEIRPAFENPKNIELLAQMLVNYLWLAASDFKLDHIGVDADGNLICLDFGESLIPFQYQESVYRSRGWNFSLTPEDLTSAPFLKTYKSSNFFIEKALAALPDIFNSLQYELNSEERLCRAILKRCIFPSMISFAALELFSDFEEVAIDLKEFMAKRTAEFCAAATQAPKFILFMLNHRELAYELIKAEIFDGALPNSRYFRHTKQEFQAKCLEELRLNFNAVTTTIELNRFKNDGYTGTDLLLMLRQFCYTEYMRLIKINETSFFKKGLSDKSALFKQLLDKIDENPFNDSEPSAVAEIVNMLIKEISIVAHHRRYSKINTFFRHSESTSWKNFVELFGSYSGDYAATIQAVLTDKSSRAIATNNQETMVSGYNEYRHAIKPQ